MPEINTTIAGSLPKPSWPAKPQVRPKAEAKLRALAAGARLLSQESAA